MASTKPKDAYSRAAVYNKQNGRGNKNFHSTLTPKQKKRVLKKSNNAGKRSLKWHDWL